jgi:preprotein translocase subunit Sss1
MYAAVIVLAYRPDRETSTAALIPGGKVGVWLAGGIGFLIVLMSILLSVIPPGESAHKWIFEVKLIGGTGFALLLGVVLFVRGARGKARDVAR